MLEDRPDHGCQLRTPRGAPTARSRPVSTRIQQPYFFTYVIDQLQRVTARTRSAKAGSGSTRRSIRGCSADAEGDQGGLTTARPGVRDRLGEPGTGRDPRDGAVVRGHEEPVQHCRPVGPASRLDLQDVRARRRDRTGRRPARPTTPGAVHLHRVAVVLEGGALERSHVRQLVPRRGLE